MDSMIHGSWVKNTHQLVCFSESFSHCCSFDSDYDRAARNILAKRCLASGFVCYVFSDLQFSILVNIRKWWRLTSVQAGLFVLVLFSLSASFIELVDLGFDQLSKKCWEVRACNIHIRPFMFLKRLLALLLLSRLPILWIEYLCLSAS